MTIDCPPVEEESSSIKKQSNSAPPTPLNRSRPSSGKKDEAASPECVSPNNKITSFNFEQALKDNARKKSSSVRLQIETMVAVL